MGAKYDYKAQGLGIKGSVEPFVNTRGTASAGIDVLIATAGIEGSLNFIDTSIKAAFQAAVDPIERQFKASLNVVHRLNLLKGNISVFAKIRRLFRRDKKFSKSIFSFGGINENRTLIDKSLSESL